jgi:hypothetical protein
MPTNGLQAFFVRKADPGRGDSVTLVIGNNFNSAVPMDAVEG